MAVVKIHLHRFNGPTPDPFLSNVSGGSPETSAHYGQDNAQTSDSHTAWSYQLHLYWQIPPHTGSPFPQKQQQGELWHLSPAVSAGIGRHMQKFHLTLQNKEQTRSYYLVQIVSLLVNWSFCTVLNTLYLLWSKKHTAKSGLVSYLKDL